MIEIDKISMLVTADTDNSIQEIDNKLSREGYTLNFLTPTGNDAILADVINERTPNLYGEAFGGIEDLCIQVRLAQPDGNLFTNVMTPRSATGPSLKNISIGSQEMLGIPIQATLRIFPKPSYRGVACVLFSGIPQREFFFQALLKNRTPLPLISPLTNPILDEIFEGLAGEEAALGLALWGEKPDVKNFMLYLRHLAHLKRGDWFEVEEEKMKNKLVDILQKEASEILLQKMQISKKELTSPQLALNKRIQEIS